MYWLLTLLADGFPPWKDWTKFWALTVSGLTRGSIYALIALGYSMVYGILKLLNFAHGDVYMMGAYVGYYILTALGGSASPAVPMALLFALMFGGAMIFCGVNLTIPTSCRRNA